MSVVVVAVVVVVVSCCVHLCEQVNTKQYIQMYWIRVFGHLFP